MWERIRSGKVGGRAGGRAQALSLHLYPVLKCLPIYYLKANLNILPSFALLSAGQALNRLFIFLSFSTCCIYSQSLRDIPFVR